MGKSVFQRHHDLVGPDQPEVLADHFVGEIGVGPARVEQFRLVPEPVALGLEHCKLCPAFLELLGIAVPGEQAVGPGNGMACDGDRCKALAGEIGKATACTIYGRRPDVCRSCMPGDDACNIARVKHGLGALT